MLCDRRNMPWVLMLIIKSANEINECIERKYSKDIYHVHVFHKILKMSVFRFKVALRIWGHGKLRRGSTPPTCPRNFSVTPLLPGYTQWSASIKLLIVVKMHQKPSERTQSDSPWGNTVLGRYMMPKIALSELQMPSSVQLSSVAAI